MEIFPVGRKKKVKAVPKAVKAHLKVDSWWKVATVT